MIVVLSSLAVFTTAAPQTPATARDAGGADTVMVRSGAVALQAICWHPSGRGPFPAVLFNHGSHSTQDTTATAEAAVIGPVFARHGYVLLFLFRQGVGLSSGLGDAEGDLMDSAAAAAGQDGRNRVQLQLLEHRAMAEAMAGLDYLRRRPEVDARRIAVAGHSFGGSLTILLAGRNTALRAAVVFSGSAFSWDRSAELRARLLAAADRTNIPVLLLHAANDYSTEPGRALAARLEQLGKQHRLTIYPAVGVTAHDGHNFVYSRVDLWENDVFAFLDEHVHR